MFRSWASELLLFSGYGSVLVAPPRWWQLVFLIIDWLAQNGASKRERISIFHPCLVVVFNFQIVRVYLNSENEMNRPRRRHAHSESNCLTKLKKKQTKQKQKSGTSSRWTWPFWLWAIIKTRWKISKWTLSCPIRHKVKRSSCFCGCIFDAQRECLTIGHWEKERENQRGKDYLYRTSKAIRYRVIFFFLSSSFFFSSILLFVCFFTIGVWECFLFLGSPSALSCSCCETFGWGRSPFGIWAHKEVGLASLPLFAEWRLQLAPACQESFSRFNNKQSLPASFLAALPMRCCC